MSVLRTTESLHLHTEEDAESLGHYAAEKGWTFHINPYPYGSDLWDVWNEAYFNTSPRRRPLGRGKRRLRLDEDEPRVTAPSEVEEYDPEIMMDCPYCGLVFGIEEDGCPNC